MIPPTHKEIAQRAESIWQENGRPSDRDTEIWLEAEQQLTARAPVPTLDESQSDQALAEKATSQRKESLAPKRPQKTAPKAPPAETGKPLWSKPHSK